MRDREEVGRRPPAALLLAARLPPDSVSRRTLEYCRLLADGGWRPFVAARDGPLATEVRRAGGRLVALPAEAGGFFARLRALRKLAAFAREEGLRVLHVQRASAAPLARAAAERLALPWLATVHDLDELGDPASEPLLTAPRLLAVSEHVAEELGERHGVPAARIRVLPPALDLAELAPERVHGARVAAVATRWGLDLGRRVLLVPGPLVPAHGHRVLLRALAKIAREDLSAVFVAAEDADRTYVRELERAIREAGLGERVRFGAPPEDEPAALQLADLVVLPAIRPLPSARVVLAAQAMGRPVVVSHLGALPECVQPASTGWIVAAGDAEELAWAIERALSLDEEVRARLALRARAFAAEGFALERVGRRLLETYEETLREAAARGPARG
ncbi:MAG: glycosyltransferase [Geminicoccaceae bacterium]|nr:glycosyltransferase [Geminicoccaceae bacterium]